MIVAASLCHIGTIALRTGKKLKRKVKSAVSFIFVFEESVVRNVRDKGLDGVICGHIHKPEHRPGEIEYVNCGDWVESCTAAVEHPCGCLEVIDGLAAIAEFVKRSRAAEEAPMEAVQPFTMPVPALPLQ